MAINASQCAGGTLANPARSHRRRLSPWAQVEGLESFAIRQRLSIAAHRHIATSQILTAADAEQLGFAVGGEGENRIAGHRAHRAVGLVKIASAIRLPATAAVASFCWAFHTIYLRFQRMLTTF